MTAPSGLTEQRSALRKSALFAYKPLPDRAGFHIRPFLGAGWSSPVARQAHNLKVVGSNPTPATNPKKDRPSGRFFYGYHA